MRRIIIFVFAAVLLWGCGKTVESTTNEINKLYFDSWVSIQKQKHPEYVWKQTSLGAWILEDKEGTGEALGEFDDSLYLRVNYTYYDFDGTISATTSEKVSQQLGDYNETYYYGPEIWYANSIYAGLEDLLKGMKRGGRRKVAIPGWLQTSERCATPEEYLSLASDKVGSNFICDIELVDYFRYVNEWELDSISRYLVRNYARHYGTDAAKARGDSAGAHGFYYIRDLAPSDTVTFRDTTVYINYIGRLLNGSVFDTNIRDTAMFHGIFSASRTYGPVAINYGSVWSDITMGSDSGDVIKGFARTLSVMKAYERGTGIFYSPLGYTYNGSGGKIPPYSPLRFDVEIVDEPKK